MRIDIDPRSCAVALALLISVGCGDSAPSPEATPDPEPTANVDNEPPAPEEPSGPSATSDSFALTATPSDGYQNGELAQYSIHLEGRNEWHVNLEFPFTVEVEGDGVQFPVTSLDRSHASSFAEEGVNIDVPFTPTRSGEVTSTAHVTFAMCNPNNCVREERRLTLAMAVE